MNFRSAGKWVLIFLATAALSAALAVYAALRGAEERVSALVESKTGLKCRVASVRPCFPSGIKASGITIYSLSGEPLLQAEEISTQFNLLRYLSNGRKQSDLLNNLEGDQIKLALVRNPDGEWNFPRSFSSRKSGSSGDAKASRRTLSFTNLNISIKTAKGEAARVYKTLEADLNPAGDSFSFKLTGADESVQVSIRNGGEKIYEVQAENFSMALLAPASSAPFPLENLLINGKIKAASNDNKKFLLSGGGKIKISSFQHAVLSSRAIDDINLPFEVSCTLTDAGIENLSGKIDMAGEAAVITGNIEGWKKPVINLSVSFSDFSYNNAIAALPASLHPTLPVIRLSGRMTGTFRIYLEMENPATLNYSYSGQVDPLQIMHLGDSVNIDALRSSFRHNVRTTRGKGVSIMLGSDNPDFIPISNIPSSAIYAVMTAEDGSFFSHRGFSKRHIRDSIIANLKAERVVRGASTISMQLAKNLYLSPERTISRKLEEALITVALEQNLGKRRMMEIYLNIIEWGNGIYGIGPAARYYFSKRPENLKPVESAFLASIIARPRHNWGRDPLSRIGSGWREYINVILCKMYERGEAELDDLIEAGVSESRISSLKSKNTFEERDNAVIE